MVSSREIDFEIAYLYVQRPGVPVMTPEGPGHVPWGRDAVDGRVVVLLDARRGLPTYRGTVFRVEDVEALTN